MDGFYPGDSQGDTPAPKDSTEADSEDTSETFLTPKSAFTDVKVGDQQMMEAVHIYEDEIEWKPVGKETETPEESKSMNEEIDSMAMDSMK